VKVEHANARQALKSRGKARYTGVAKNDFDANRIAAANNLQFLDRQMRAEEEAA
jgi:sulfur carrier protein ThiS